MSISTLQQALESLAQLEDRQLVDAMTELLLGLKESDHGLEREGVEDLTRPYGRRVLFDGERLESMLAQWTPGRHCAPHDHGGAIGRVMVIQGQAVHRIYRQGESSLEQAFEETVGPGEILACGPRMIHSMGDAGAERPLMTLHLYHQSIPFMRVFDLDEARTYRVSGDCGAWIPHDRPEQILSVREGLGA